MSRVEEEVVARACAAWRPVRPEPTMATRSLRRDGGPLDVEVEADELDAILVVERSVVCTLMLRVCLLAIRLCEGALLS